MAHLERSTVYMSFEAASKLLSTCDTHGTHLGHEGRGMGNLAEDQKMLLSNVDFLQWRVKDRTKKQTFLSPHLLHQLKVPGTFVRTPRRGHQDQLLNLKLALTPAAARSWNISWRSAAALAPWGTPLQTLASATSRSFLFSKEQAHKANIAMARWIELFLAQHNLGANSDLKLEMFDRLDSRYDVRLYLMS